MFDAAPRGHRTVRSILMIVQSVLSSTGSRATLGVRTAEHHMASLCLTETRAKHGLDTARQSLAISRKNLGHSTASLSLTRSKANLGHRTTHRRSKNSTLGTRNCQPGPSSPSLHQSAIVVLDSLLYLPQHLFRTKALISLHKDH